MAIAYARKALFWEKFKLISRVLGSNRIVSVCGVRERVLGNSNCCLVALTLWKARSLFDKKWNSAGPLVAKNT